MKRIVKEQAERLLDAFRKHPGMPSPASRVSGVDVRTARKAWRHGLKSCNDPKFHEPFQMLIAREQEEARARMQVEKDELAKRALQHEAERRAEVVEQASKDVTESRVQEASMVRMARSGAIVLLNTLTNVSAGTVVIGKKVRHTLETIGNDPSRNLTIKEASTITAMLNRLTTSLRQANDAAQKAMEMERLLLGEPTSITGHVSLEPVTVEEAREKMAAVERTIRALEAEGIGVIGGSPNEGDPSFN